MSYDREYDDSEYDESYQEGDIRRSQYSVDDYDTDEEDGGDSPSAYSGQPAGYYQPEYDPADFRDEDKEGVSDRRRWINALILCCCCLLCIIIAIVVPIVLKKSKSPVGPPVPPPTPAPTKAPQAPYMLPTRAPAIGAPLYLPSATTQPSTSGQPTVQPEPTLPPVADPTFPPTQNPTANPTKSPAPTPSVPDELVIIPSGDTYIQKGIGETDGENDVDVREFDPRGKEEVVLVQNTIVDPFDTRKNSDAFALLDFDLSLVPFASIVNRINTATLELQHRLSARNGGIKTYTVQRVPSTPLAVETLHAGIYVLPDTGVGNITFGVNAQDENVTIDVTPLFFGDIYEPADDEEALLLIADFGPESPDGDAFYARESPGREPKLRLKFQRVVGDIPLN